MGHTSPKEALDAVRHVKLVLMDQVIQLTEAALRMS
jgi:hypothetical protein